MNRNAQATEEQQQSHKNTKLMKMVLVFMFICIICSFLLNILLYCRIRSLKKQINALDRGCYTTEQVMTGGTI